MVDSLATEDSLHSAVAGMDSKRQRAEKKYYQYTKDWEQMIK